MNRQIAHHTIGCLFECQMTVRAQGASHLMVNVTCEDCGLGSSKQGTNSGAFETSTRGRSSWQTTTKISLETRISSSHEVTRSLGHSVKIAPWSATAINIIEQIRRDNGWRSSMQGLQQISQISKSSTQCYIDFLRRGSGDITINEIPPIDHHVERQ